MFGDFCLPGRERGGPGGPPLDKRGKHGRIKVKREPHQQAVSPVQDQDLANAKKPSLARVAVSAFPLDIRREHGTIEVKRATPASG